ncbi:uncharacterized protein A1O9_04701 [Exophiala aquamarina CBS 119918]|uniref:Uncharacterized protein n=1 Tax=Exophiala aquamarina CBS 119918 TaxID=1182545 RepID=A0A072PKK5_9EURO|nr:uncharacterized protein A1O9_04701 [Exophiala aquamarina CBS 119918]KEF59853.1 hypothetical protein A1O9_04701 [Exophiala aquamarina CBS 119918]
MLVRVNMTELLVEFGVRKFLHVIFNPFTLAVSTIVLLLNITFQDLAFVIPTTVRTTLSDRTLII